MVFKVELDMFLTLIQILKALFAKAPDPPSRAYRLRGAASGLSRYFKGLWDLRQVGMAGFRFPG